MISEAIRTTIVGQTGMPSALLKKLDDDDEPVYPFTAFEVRTQPIRGKEGVLGYVTYSKVIVVDQDIGNVRTQAQQVITALEGMAGQTINNTEIKSVFWNDKEPDQLETPEDEKLTIYIEEIEFKINHKTE